MCSHGQIDYMYLYSETPTRNRLESLIEQDRFLFERNKETSYKEVQKEILKEVFDGHHRHRFMVGYLYRGTSV